MEIPISLEFLLINMRELRKRRGLTQQELAAVLGETNTTISNWEKGNTTPGIKDLMKISMFYGVSLSALVSPAGVDDRPAPPPPVKGKASPPARAVQHAPVPKEGIIVLDIQAAAGYADSGFRAEYLNGKPKMALHGEQYKAPGMFAIQVSGDSMAPTIHQGDWLVVRKLERPLEELKEGYVHVVLSTTEGPVAKRLYFGPGRKSLRLRSDNPTYPEQQISGEGYVEVYRALRLMRDDLGTQGQDLHARVDRLERDMATLLKARK